MKPSTKPDIRAVILRMIDFIRADIWRIRLADLPFGKSFLIKQLRIIILAIRGFDEDKCFVRASSLTFYTLLSIVPVVAMFFGVAKGFGFEKILERRLYANFRGQEEIIEKVITFSNSLLQQTQGGIIAGIGLAVLFWSALKVLNHIERSFNDIWEIKTGRSWGRKFSDYLAIVLLSPLFILLSSSATVYVTTQITALANQIKLLGFFSPLIFFSFKLIPYVLIWILFTIIYVLMPNTRVKIKAGFFRAEVIMLTGHATIESGITGTSSSLSAWRILLNQGLP